MLAPRSLYSWWFCALLLSTFALMVKQTAAADTQWVTTTDADGNTVYLQDDRKPSLYTGNFGDCLGSSVINVTRFDAAYYKDNMTVLFHLEGTTNIHNESLMMYIGVFAYGENRFDLTFNPCSANIDSLCPMQADIPIEANGIIPVSDSDVATIPAIALTIPDFEGQAILRIFANSTQTEIGCFSAVVTNGATFSHPAAVGTVLGVFTVVAIVASFATTIYGDHLPRMRSHYAHSVSVLVVFAVLHHIFFTGALTVNWPSVLAAFWSNYAWAGGMIYVQSMQDTINKFIGSNTGNTTSVGAASSGSTDNTLGGGYQISEIYRRSMSAARLFSRDVLFDFDDIIKSRMAEQTIARRALANSSDGYSWYGQPVKPGIPLPGNWSGFAGELSIENIPASNAFMTGFLWYLVLIAFVAGSVVTLKLLLEGFTAAKFVKRNSLTYFRSNWTGYLASSILRTLYISFYMMVLLSMFQFTYKGTCGVAALAAIVFVFFFAGMISIVFYGCLHRLRYGRFQLQSDRILIQKKVWKVLPLFEFKMESQQDKDTTTTKASYGSIGWWKIAFIDNDPLRKSVHEDENYITTFGWLASRFRRRRWWFFAPWIIYEFIRACLYGGAAGRPRTQLIALLVIEILAFIGLVILRPFEGARLNALVVYALSFSKVTTLGLSIAFDQRYNLNRITTTVIGIVIIVIQGILTILLLIAIVIGAFSSYMSVTRNSEDFKPRSWLPLRNWYLNHIDKAAADLPPPPPEKPKMPEEPYFSVASVRRLPKIEDEDKESIADGDLLSSRNSVNPQVRASRTNSVHSNMSYSTLPFGARLHRASWSSRDFQNWRENDPRSSEIFRQSGANSSIHGLPQSSSSRLETHTRTASRVGSPLAEAKEDEVE